jgi:predicted Zn-dependent protease with MMP-like domain
MNPTRWDRLLAKAQKIIDKTIAELPREVAAEARQIPVIFEEVCEEDPDILGHYGNFEPGEISEAKGPIVLYLATIEAFSQDEGEDFAEQVRITYLHELGHHIGFDEVDLEERGLE